jgi:tetratricopeptide (TPR) repeat protein
LVVEIPSGFLFYCWGKCVKSERYATAEELKKDLSDCVGSVSEVEYDTVVIPPAAAGGDSQDALSGNSVNSYTQTQGATMTMGAQDAQSAASLAEEQNPYADGKKTGGRKKKLIVFSSVAGGLLIAAAVVFFIVVPKLTDPVNRFESAVKSGDMVSAAQLYRDELRYEDSGRLAEAGEFVVDQAEKVKASYIGGEIEYETALTRLQEMGKLGIVSADELEPFIEGINEMRVSRDAYENAQSESKSGEYASAINELHKVIPADSNYGEAQTQLTDAIKIYKEQVLASLSQYGSEDLYDDAVSALRAALLVVPADADLLEKIADYEKKIADEIALIADDLIRDAKNKATISVDYENALADLRSAVASYPSSEMLKTALAEMEQEYVTKKIAEADNLIFDGGEYKDAVALLEEALNLAPGDASLKSAIAEYEAKYPSLLQQMTYFTGRDLGNGGQEQDNLQGIQINIITTDDGDRFDNVYKLDGSYRKITGVLYQPFDSRSDNAARKLEIFGDDRLLYSAVMSGGIEPKTFSVSLTGVKDLEVRLSTDSGWRGRARLANVQLYQ